MERKAVVLTSENVNPVEAAVLRRARDYAGSLTVEAPVGLDYGTAEPPRPSANASGHKLIRNALVGYLSTGVGLVIGLVTTPILLRHFGVGNFGIWALMGTVAAYTGLVEAGLGTALAKRVAEHDATNDSDSLNRVLGTAFVMYLVAGALVLVESIVLAMFVGRLFNLAPGEVAPARMCLLVLGCNQAISFLFTSQTAVLYGSGRFDLMDGTSLVINVVAATLNILAAVTGFGIVTLAVITVATTVANGVVMRFIIRKQFPGVRIKPRAFDRPTVFALLRFGSKNWAIYICSAVAFGSDSLVIGFFLPVSAVAQYFIAAKLTNLVRTLAEKPIDVAMPSFAHAAALDDRSRLFRLWTEATMLSLAVAVPVVIGLCVFSEKAVTFWVGPGHMESASVLVVLSLVSLFLLPGHVCLKITTGAERNDFFAKVMAVSAPVNLALSMALTMWLHSPIGVALGSLITIGIANFLVIPIHTCRQFGLGIREYAVRSFGPLLLPSAATLVVAFTVRQMARSAGRPWTPALMASVGCLFCASLWLAVGTGRRQAYLTKLRRLLGRDSRHELAEGDQATVPATAAA
jgi:O-antigen/teichoic acid export membrane protein